MIRGMLAGLALVASVAAVSAQSDPIVERQQLMKKNGQDMRTLSNMQRGSAPFDLAKAQATLAGLVIDSRKAAALFPANSQTGGETRSLPKIWTEKAAFDASFAKFEATIVAAQAATKDEASFKGEFTKISNACDSCHEAYRAPRR